jgi:thioredoxin-like negative regulator of GroEL
MLGKVGMFDGAKPENQVDLRADHHLSEIRLESYDEGLSDALSRIRASDDGAYAKAREAIENGDSETAKSLLMPFAEEVGELQLAARLALILGDLWMFEPRRPTIGSPME